jgi:uncharacterized cofD-like protein
MRPSYETATDPLLEALDFDASGPAVAAIGGGHGLAQALRAIQLYTPDVSAIVTVADNGGSSGRLAPALGIPPPGDIRMCLVALAPEASRWRDLFEFRFTEGDVEGHSLGNLMLAALAADAGDFESGVIEAERSLGVIGSVIPVALEAMHLRAMIDGNVVEGQHDIVQARGTLESIEVFPEEVKATPRALDALSRADQIVLGPGSLFTSTIAALLVPGIVDAINGADAQLVYVCNLITQDGETLGLSAEDHLAALADRTGLRSPDAVVANEGEVVVPKPHEPLRLDERKVQARVLYADLVDPGHDWPHHEPHRLSTVLSALARS